MKIDSSPTLTKRHRYHQNRLSARLTSNPETKRSITWSNSLQNSLQPECLVETDLSEPLKRMKSSIDKSVKFLLCLLSRYPDQRSSISVRRRCSVYRRSKYPSTNKVALPMTRIVRIDKIRAPSASATYSFPRIPTVFSRHPRTTQLRDRKQAYEERSARLDLGGNGLWRMPSHDATGNWIIECNAVSCLSIYLKRHVDAARLEDRSGGSARLPAPSRFKLGSETVLDGAASRPTDTRREFKWAPSASRFRASVVNLVPRCETLAHQCPAPFDVRVQGWIVFLPYRCYQFT